MKNVKNAALYLITGLIFVVGGAWISSKLVKQESVSQAPRTIIECPANIASYDSLAKDPGHVVKLISKRKSMFATNGEFINSQVVITKSETQNSKIACGYLFVRAGTSTGSLKKWENLYINPNDFGGHMDPKGQIGPGDGNNFSDYLFPLNQIHYWKDLTAHAQGALSHADWAALLNVSDTVSFNIALNTEDKTGFIDEMSIAYKCWNPTTGEENNDCRLNLSGSTDTKANTIQ